MRWISRTLAVAGAALVVAGLTVQSSRAQSTLGGFDLSASADGVAMYYDQPSAGQAFSPIFEVDAAHSFASLSAGPTSRALSSAFWPGATGGDGDVCLIYPTDSPVPCPKFPRYPVRAEATAPGGSPAATNKDVPGTTMDAVASATGATAKTFTEGMEVPGVVKTGTVRTSSSTKLTDTEVVASGVTRTSDITLFGGLITIDSVVSEATVTSNGKKTTYTPGTTKVGGVKVQDQEAVADGGGLSLGGEKVPVEPVTKQLNEQVLKQAGVTMSVAGPLQTSDETSITRTLGGVVVHISGKGLENLFAAMPPEMASQFQGNFPTDQSLTIVIGGVTVATSASEGGGLFEDDLGGTTDAGLVIPSDAAVTDVESGQATTGSDSGSGESAGGDEAAGSEGATAGEEVAQPASDSDPISVAGLPVFGVGAALLAAAVIGDRLRALSNLLLAAGRVPERTCPLAEDV